MSKLDDAMDAVAAVNRTAGVTQRGGKLYTMVQDRVLVWRRHFGLEHGVESEIVRDDGKVVQIRCTIRDSDGRILATGHAEEVRGSSNVNKTSAIENGETSALGRALAAMGLHGFEFASANEMDKVERMDASSGRFISSTSTPPAAEPKPPVVVENIEDTLTFDEPIDELVAANSEEWSGWVAEQIAGFDTHKTTKEHKQWSSTVKADRDRLAREDKTLHDELLRAYGDRKLELENRSKSHAE
jgi:deoxycytidylate deaminase